MKHIIRNVCVILLCTLLITPRKAHAQEVSVSIQTFYDQLSPYGEWVENPDYGYVWTPTVDVDASFTPYETAGHWVLTDYGWTWVSDYPWGWAAFHYGRWNYDSYYGWYWIPDTQWGPAWVAWRKSNGYYGWAPLPPQREGFSISLGFGGLSFDVEIPTERWVFVRDVDVMQPEVHRYYVPREQNVTIIRNTTVIKNTYVDRSRNVTYVVGPDQTEVQRVTGRPVQKVVIKETSQPQQTQNGNALVIYRPQVKRTDNNGNRPAPRKIVTQDQVRQRRTQQQNQQGNNNNQNINQQQRDQNKNGLNNDQQNNQSQDRNRQDNNPQNNNQQNNNRQNAEQPRNYRDTNNNKLNDQQMNRQNENQQNNNKQNKDQQNNRQNEQQNNNRQNPEQPKNYRDTTNNRLNNQERNRQNENQDNNQQNINRNNQQEQNMRDTSSAQRHGQPSAMPQNKNAGNAKSGQQKKVKPKTPPPANTQKAPQRDTTHHQ